MIASDQPVKPHVQSIYTEHYGKTMQESVCFTHTYNDNDNHVKLTSSDQYRLLYGAQ